MRSKKNKQPSGKPFTPVHPANTGTHALPDNNDATDVGNDMVAAAKWGVTARHLEKAKAVEQIIRKDFSVWHSVAALAETVGLTELELQTAFKIIYGQTVALYAREARLQYAHEQLEQTDAPLRVICEMVGYPDPSNFSLAFLKQFGYRPGKVKMAKPAVNIQGLLVSLYSDKPTNLN